MGIANPIWLKRGSRITAIDLTQLLYVDGYKYGCTLHIYSSVDSHHDKLIKTQSTLSSLERALSSYGFIRCHRNYLINPVLAKKFQMNNSSIPIDSVSIPVARRKRKIVAWLAVAIN